MGWVGPALPLPVGGVGALPPQPGPACPALARPGGGVPLEESRGAESCQTSPVSFSALYIYLNAIERQGVPGVPRKKLPPLRPLTEQQKKAVQMTYDYYPVQEIADTLGIHRSTLWRWKQMREFWADYRRIDRNWRRKFERREAKRRAQEEAYWEEQIKIAEENLQKESEKVVNKPGKAWYAAYNAYMKAQLHGHSWTDVMKCFEAGEYKPRKRRRRK